MHLNDDNNFLVSTHQGNAWLCMHLIAIMTVRTVLNDLPKFNKKPNKFVRTVWRCMRVYNAVVQRAVKLY